MGPFDNRLDVYTLNTGRTFSANQGIIGIKITAEGFAVSEGYDGGIPEANHPSEADQYEDCWTAEEKRDLADYMIGLWTAYRDAVSK